MIGCRINDYGKFDLGGEDDTFSLADIIVVATEKLERTVIAAPFVSAVAPACVEVFVKSPAQTSVTPPVAMLKGFLKEKPVNKISVNDVISLVAEGKDSDSAHQAVLKIEWDIGDSGVLTIDPGNAVDPASGGLYGVVDHSFQMGKYLVTYDQYCAFLNAVDPSGANPNNVYFAGFMTDDPCGGINYTAVATAGAKYTIKPGIGSKPVIGVDFSSSGRFVNWLGNGGMKGSNTDTGVYTITAQTSINNARTGNTGNGTRVFLPTENEWYKAAYYQGVGNTNTAYPWGATVPDANGLVGGNLVANLNYAGCAGTVTDVTSFPNGKSYYQTFDQAGNASEMLETIHTDPNRVVRGGRWNNTSGFIKSSTKDGNGLTTHSIYIGFRVCR
jgi:formylglycine-generating enzyme required for sulfatase activity